MTGESTQSRRGTWLRDHILPLVLGTLIFGLIVAVAAPFIEDWIRTGVDEQGPADFWRPIGFTLLAVLVGLVILVALAVSVASRKWRNRVWRQPFEWAKGLRVTTRAERERIEVQGYERRSAEVRAERDVAPRPAWRVDPRDRLWGQQTLHWLENYGYQVFDVAVTCDPEVFKLDGDAFFPGGFGTNVPGGSVGQQFHGTPTDRGREEGVTFTVTWRDKNGDWHSEPVYMSPDDIRVGKDDAIEHASELAWKEGYAAAKAALEESALEESIPPRQPPLPRPRWTIDADTGDGASDWYTIQNHVPRSVAREVRVEAGPDFEIRDAGHWEDLSVTGPTNGTGHFQAFSSERGHLSGVDVVVTWYDENGERQAETRRVWPTRTSPDPF